MLGLHSDVITTQSFPPELDSVRAARHVTVGLLGGKSDARVTDDAALVVTELAANAVLHARSGFTLTISRSAAALRIAVRDNRPLVPEGDGRPFGDRPFDVRAGHGLSVVGQVARAWAVERLPDGKVVWAELGSRRESLRQPADRRYAAPCSRRHLIIRFTTSRGHCIGACAQEGGFVPAGPDGQAGSVPFDITIAHSSRVYDYWLGGKDHFAADREAAELALKAYPGIAVAARANRAFLARVVRYLAAEAGIRQFLDIGSGIPTARNTHEVAQSAAAECRVVYVDHDPVVLAHSRALLNSHPAGATDYIQADLLDPGDILGQAAKTLDFSRPVALLLMSVVHLIPDEAAPHAIIGRLTGAVAPGSFLAISHGTGDLDARVVAMSADLTGVLVEPVTARTRDQVARFFDGLELVEPGLVPIPQWRPASSEEAAVKASLWGGVARKPALSAH